MAPDVHLFYSHFDRFSKKVTKTTGKLANTSRQTWGRSKNNKFTQPQDDLWGCKEAAVNQRTDKLGFCEKNLLNFLTREKLTKKNKVSNKAKLQFYHLKIVHNTNFANLLNDKLLFCITVNSIIQELKFCKIAQLFCVWKKIWDNWDRKKYH